MIQKKKYTLAELASLTGSTLIGDTESCISGVDTLELATSEDASFLANPRYMSAMKQSKAGVICIHSAISPIEGKNFLVSDHPSHAFQKIAEVFFSQDSRSGFSGIHPTAVIHEKATIGKNVVIGPYAVIDQGASIGDETQIGPFVYVGAASVIGANCNLHAHSVVREGCFLGDRVILQPGAVVGSCGFGYLTDSLGNHLKLEQLGTVVIEDDVEIGANTTIDRARFKTTRVGKGTKLDNLVQIAHNVEIGPHNLIAAQTGVAGSAKTGSHVFMGGQAGVVGHLEIVSGTMIATRGGVSKTIKEPGKYAGGPVMPLSEHNRQQVHLRKISEYAEKIQELEKRLEELEKKLQTADNLI